MSRRVADISVAISTRHRPEALARCLDALAAGEVLPAEVVVVDQSRDDRTQRVLEERRGGPLHLIYGRQDAQGLAVAQNAAVARTAQPVVAVTDDDCVPDPGWLAVVERAFADPGLDGLGGRVLPLEAEGEKIYPVSSRTSTVRRDFHGWAAPWEVGSGNNFAVRRPVWDRIGGCDERLGPGSPAQGGVDMDLFYRLLRAGARLRYEPEALVFHERQTLADRLARRPMYGRGMGACCRLRLREGDWGALRLLGAWLALRLRALARGRVREEMLMLGGTVRGLVVG
jgi:GT2 family glycosyltransferase